MLPVNQIVELKEYKNHIFTAALSNFSNSENKPALYGDSVNGAILYHLRYCKHCKFGRDELKISNIPAFLNENERDISQNTYDILTEIYNKVNTIAAQHKYSDNCNFGEIRKAYDINDPCEMWSNKEFSERFKKDVDAITKLLQPIQDLVETL